MESKIFERNRAIDVDPKPCADGIQPGEDIPRPVRRHRLGKTPERREQVDIDNSFIGLLIAQIKKILKQEIEDV